MDRIQSKLKLRNHEIIISLLLIILRSALCTFKMDAPYIPGVPVEVGNVSISGNARTKVAFFEKELIDALGATTIDSLHAKMDKTVDRMRGYGVFDAVSADIAITEANVTGNKYKVNLSMQVKEKGIPQLRVESYVKAGSKAVGDITFEAQGALRNPFGYGESATISIGGTTIGSQEALATISIPSPAPLLNTLSITSRSSTDNLSVFTGIQQKETSLTAQTSLNTSALARLFRRETTATPGQHSFQCSYALRDEIPLPKAPEAILLVAQTSTKASLKYNYTLDTRDSGLHSSRGTLVDASIEAALAPGSTHFIKSDIRAESYHALPAPGLGLSLHGFLGYLTPLSGNSALTDRYFLGGPMSLRGFGMFGCGPRAVGGFPLGGNAKATLLAVLQCPLPIPALADSGGRSFLFFNCGTLGKGFPSALPFGYMRASVGAGVSFAFGPARFECTYALPLVRAEHDVVRQFQFGAGLTIV